MPKNIIICSDGTGNSAIKDRGTNVFKLFEAVDLNGHRTDPNLAPQVAIYDDGVGTESFLPLKILGGAFGWGLKRSVLKLYTGLVRIYDPGDRIYLFGFSRGAFTVRTLGGLIAKCGVLDWTKMATTDAMRAEVAAAYEVYREGYRTWLWRTLHGKSVKEVQTDATEAMSKFKKDQGAHDADIHFLGVWDTVDSVGGPFHIADAINTLIHCFKFPDYTLSDKVNCAVHALSIDDSRAAFEPRLWEDNANLEQVWFAGVHANVGGGYTKQGMSLVALSWMLQKASQRELRIFPEEKKWYAERGNVDDKLYDSRAGLGVFYQWRPRDMKGLIDKQKAGAPKLHLSVLERIAHGTDGYAPGTLAQDVDVVYTPTGDPDQDRAAGLRAEAAKAAVNDSLRRGRNDLEKLAGTVVVGQIAYGFYVASCLATIVALGAFLRFDLRLSIWILGASIAGFATAAALAYTVSHKRNLAFSRFWHKSREELRGALKTARTMAKEDQPVSSPPATFPPKAATMGD